jgi:hypothetical protein
MLLGRCFSAICVDKCFLSDDDPVKNRNSMAYWILFAGMDRPEEGEAGSIDYQWLGQIDHRPTATPGKNEILVRFTSSS